MIDLGPIQDRLGLRFKNEAFLRQALTHRSYSAQHNERLEFLGDSVLNLAVAALLYERFPKLSEGDLSRVRSNLVKQQALVEIAQSLGLGQSMLLGEGEVKSGGVRRPSILADTLEAIIGGIYLDRGPDEAIQWVHRIYQKVLAQVDPHTLGKDAKTLLQEHLQGLQLSLPVYTVVATHGAAHNQVFEVECLISKFEIRTLGSGGSRRAAEQTAASLALEEVRQASKQTDTPLKRSRRASKRSANRSEPKVEVVETRIERRASSRVAGVSAGSMGTQANPSTTSN